MCVAKKNQARAGFPATEKFVSVPLSPPTASQPVSELNHQGGRQRASKNSVTTLVITQSYRETLYQTGMVMYRDHHFMKTLYWRRKPAGNGRAEIDTHHAPKVKHACIYPGLKIKTSSPIYRILAFGSATTSQVVVRT